MRRFLRIAWIPVLIAVTLAGWQAWHLYNRIFAPAVQVPEGAAYLFISTGAGFHEVVDSLHFHGYIEDTTAFRWVAQRKEYLDRVRPGRYRLEDGMSLNALINRLRAGQQEAVRLVVRPHRNLDDLVSFLAQQLEPDIEAFKHALSDHVLLKEAELTPAQAMLLSIPNTYEIWWTITAEGFARRMLNEYNRFWTEERRNKARKIQLDPARVSIMASIVQEETNKRDEMARIAGVYLNRLRIGMLLQADPTVKYALGNPAIRRILYRHLEVDSPYNTYRYPGLPPGPIAMPETYVIDAVLNAEKHDYLFFCARADLSGYHAFARSGAEHARNARAYQQALNRQGIY